MGLSAPALVLDLGSPGPRPARASGLREASARTPAAENETSAIETIGANCSADRIRSAGTYARRRSRARLALRRRQSEAHRASPAEADVRDPPASPGSETLPSCSAPSGGTERTASILITRRGARRGRDGPAGRRLVRASAIGRLQRLRRLRGVRRGDAQTSSAWYTASEHARRSRGLVTGVGLVTMSRGSGSLGSALGLRRGRRSWYGSAAPGLKTGRRSPSSRLPGFYAEFSAIFHAGFIGRRCPRARAFGRSCSRLCWNRLLCGGGQEPAGVRLERWRRLTRGTSTARANEKHSDPTQLVHVRSAIMAQRLAPGAELSLLS
jgi:hypothetical protein